MRTRPILTALIAGTALFVALSAIAFLLRAEAMTLLGATGRTHALAVDEHLRGRLDTVLALERVGLLSRSERTILDIETPPFEQVLRLQAVGAGVRIGDHAVEHGPGVGSPCHRRDGTRGGRHGSTFSGLIGNAGEGRGSHGGKVNPGGWKIRPRAISASGLACAMSLVPYCGTWVRIF